MTPEMREAERKRRLWEAHLSRVEANGGKKTPRVKMTPEEAKERRREQTRQWKRDNAEHVNAYNREYEAKRLAAMTPEQLEARREKNNARARERYASNPGLRARKAEYARQWRLRKKGEAACKA